MFCVAFMIGGHEAAVQFAIALLFMSRNKKDVCVLTRFFYEYGLCVLCSMYDICS